jgi:hypothetical protein
LNMSLRSNIDLRYIFCKSTVHHIASMMYCRSNVDILYIPYGSKIVLREI